MERAAEQIDSKTQIKSIKGALLNFAAAEGQELPPGKN